MSIMRLTMAGGAGYALPKCLKTRISSGKTPRQQRLFLRPEIYQSTGAMEQEHKTRKGNTARSARYEFSTFAPTNPLEDGLMAFQVSSRSIPMPKLGLNPPAITYGAAEVTC